jgi:hypothetical protein
MKTFTLIKGEIGHRIIYSYDWHELKHLMRYQIEERSTSLTPDLLQTDDTDLLRAITVKQGKPIPAKIFTAVYI